MKIIKGEIISNNKMGDDVYKMTIFSPYIVKHCIPGQFINIKCSENDVYDPLLRRPFSIFDVEEDFNVFSILYLLKGKGTRYMKSLGPGDTVDFIGPLGNGIKINEDELKKNYLLVGGGIGVAPLFYLTKYLSLKKSNVFLVAGFKDNNFMFFEKLLQPLKINYQIYSENGAYGKRGIVTDYIYNHMNEFKDFGIYCCGPVEMLKELKGLFKKNYMEDNAYALFEEIMACGIGVCKGCAIKIAETDGSNSTYKTVCKDGPLFKLKDVIFE
jgi:dihydroorotate dehydrogenase electron transfer subunit